MKSWNVGHCCSPVLASHNQTKKWKPGTAQYAVDNGSQSIGRGSGWYRWTGQFQRPTGWCKMTWRSLMHRTPKLFPTSFT
eukprot:4112013-Alexandrium_andersonii.AAC.1